MNQTGILSRQEIEALIRAGTPLVSGFTDLETQLQPNGFDLTIEAVHTLSGPGTIALENAGRRLPDLLPLDPDQEGYFSLDPGPYHITYAETVALPNDLMAFGRPRSSLTRSSRRCGRTFSLSMRARSRSTR